MKTSKTNSNRRLVIYSTLMVATMLFIFYCSSQEAMESQAVSDTTLEVILNTVGRSLSDSVKLFLEEYIRKIAHFIIYMILGIFSFLTINEWKKDEYTNRLLMESAFLLSMVYAISDELHQKFVTGRSCEWTDVSLDSIGALTGILIVFIIQRLFIKGHNKNTALDFPELY